MVSLKDIRNERVSWGAFVDIMHLLSSLKNIQKKSIWPAFRCVWNWHPSSDTASQSGETADSLAALREAKEHGVRTLGIVNVVGSSIAREADNVFYTLAGPKISVATTKAYSTQLIAAYTLAIQFAKVRGEITDEQYAAYIKELQTIPDKIRKILEDKERIQWFAAKQANAKDVFFIGRGIDYAICLEGSLKMKEISYIHSESL